MQVSTQTIKEYAAVGLHYSDLEMAVYSSILVCKIPWTGALPGYSPGGQKEPDMTERLHFLSFRFKIYFTGFMFESS